MAWANAKDIKSHQQFGDRWFWSRKVQWQRGEVKVDQQPADNKVSMRNLKLWNKMLKSILILPWLQMGCWYDGIHDVTRGRRSAHNRRTQSLDEQNQEDAERQRYSRRTNACLPAPLTFKQSSFYWQVIALLLIYCIIFFSGQQATDSGNNLRIFQRKRCEFRKSSEWVNTLY